MNANSELPEGWKKTTIGEVCEILAGYGFPKNLQGKASGDLPFYKVGDISQAWLSGNRYLVKANNYLSQEEAKKIKAEPLPAGTTVMAKIGEAIKLNRRALLAKPSLVDNNVMGIFPKPDYVDQKYNFYYLLTTSLGDYSQATTVPSVRKSDVSKIFFPLAPLDQQKRIVAEIEKQFSRLDEAVVALKRIQANLKRYKASVLKAAVEGKLTEQWRKEHPDIKPASELLKRILVERRKKWEEDYVKKYVGAHGHAPKDEAWKKKYKEPASPDAANLPELPKGWVWVTLGQLIDEPKYGTSKKCDYKTDGIGVLRIPNIVNGFVDISDLKFAKFDENEIQTYRLRVGDILTIRSNGSVSLVGKCALVSKSDEKYLYAGYLIKIRPLGGIVHSEYLMICLSSLSLRKQIEAKAKSTSGVNNINAGELESLIVPICGKEEQKEIIRIVDEKLSDIEHLWLEVDSILKRAERLRHSILQYAFRGNLKKEKTKHEREDVL